jgi:uncharacterized iron-regulated protein
MLNKLHYIILVCCTALPNIVCAGNIITRMSDGQTVSFPQMMEETKNTDVIFVAETHDNKKNHELQLDVIRSLVARKIPVAIGLEMFQTHFQKQLDDWIEGRITEQSFKTVYEKNWSYDWSLYRDIFIFARDNRITMVALNIPKEIMTLITRQGFSSLTPDELKNIPIGVTRDLNKTQTEFLKKTFTAVFNREPAGKMFANICEAQAVRNSGMAIIISDTRKKYPGKAVVALAGTWHAVKQHGIPANMENIRHQSFKVILPDIPELGRTNTTSALTDYLVEQ